MIRSIIVDDEKKSRESLQILIEDFCEDVEVLALCQNVKEGLKAIETHDPDIVFLDIQMQRETGFDLLESATNINFEVIFTTAHTEYAIKAFQFSAIDYLLKPVDIQDLQKAIKKVKNRQPKNIQSQLEFLLRSIKSPSEKLNRIALPCSDGLIFVETDDILYCEASSNYTEIFTKDGSKHLVSRTLKEYENMLQSHNFYRIHNAHLINIGAIQKYVKGDGGYVVLTNGKSLDVSKRKKEGFLSKLNQI